MLRYEEGLLVESFSCRPEGFTVDHLGRRESLPNRLCLLFRGGGEGCMVVISSCRASGGVAFFMHPRSHSLDNDNYDHLPGCREDSPSSSTSPPTTEGGTNH